MPFLGNLGLGRGSDIAGAYAAFGKRAYLLIEVEPGNEVSVINELRKMKKVNSVDPVLGGYDIVCILKGTYLDIQETVMNVRKLPHVTKTTTLTAFETHLE